MFNKLETVANRYEQIGIELTRPDVVSDNELFRKLMKEHSELTPIVEKYREYTAAVQQEKDALEILGEAGIGFLNLSSNKPSFSSFCFNNLYFNETSPSPSCKILSQSN